ncbi:hypothetical protein [Paenarthrobacter sp. C1]|uniref:hypothetical protein n=1 Tax=Paenarthrobacter sp. C1 TaxID=3400220 RepID=UPI003BF478D5
MAAFLEDPLDVSAGSVGFDGSELTQSPILNGDPAAILLVSYDIALSQASVHGLLVMYKGSFVEDIKVPDLVAGKAQHAYTKALINAVPSMNAPKVQPFTTIPEVIVFQTTAVSQETPDLDREVAVARTAAGFHEPAHGQVLLDGESM